MDPGVGPVDLSSPGARCHLRGRVDRKSPQGCFCSGPPSERPAAWQSAQHPFPRGLGPVLASPGSPGKGMEWG